MTPKPVIAFDWYRSFIEFLVNSDAHIWLSKIIIFGELAIALGLILGASTGLAGSSAADELELHYGRVRVHQWYAVRDCNVVSWRGEMPDGLGLTARCCLCWARRGKAAACFVAFEPRKQLERH